ncbi:PucR C-terminal helix-turn-helix domain-containing protein [Klenkia soli]|uniref:PucR C-terminal helix-turn-helix domain-containing protein n=1 Tax=Klenkia soli TaxID=1052260 RepID=A0A1H0SGL9_9ACTN|nr:helix-turn-helix domain-containing protein [Klenkia soli]SDP40825.1 PucR C-terminal helix-turn-helix domain-containing protein [Klenkia soli]
MNDLAMRLAALDPEVGAALRAVGHFDALLAARAGLQDVVRGAAELAGCAARYVDHERGLVVRAQPDGVLAAGSAATDPGWVRTGVEGTGGELLLERPGPAGTRDAVVLERAAAAVGTVLDRTRRGRPGADPASVEVVLDPAATPADRQAAAHRLGLTGPARAVALADGRWAVVCGGEPAPAGVRCGTGPAVPVEELPGSAELAALALRLTAEGTAEDPGPREVHADDVATVLALVRAVDDAPPLPDVRALQGAAAAGPWVLTTLDAVATTGSQRDAARALHLHHSTLQDRLQHAEQMLGWGVRDPAGRLRLQLALHLHRAARSGVGGRQGADRR